MIKKPGKKNPKDKLTVEDLKKLKGVGLSWHPFFW